MSATSGERRISGRNVLLYYAWSRPAETGAPLEEIDDRFPALFELRRIAYPTYEEIATRDGIDQGIGGFLHFVQKPNFAAFAELGAERTGNPVVQIERITDDGTLTTLDALLGPDLDTIVIISFDSRRTSQAASSREIDATRRFLDDPDHVVFVCVHHDIGETESPSRASRIESQTAEHVHHGDRAIPPRQGFSGFARSLLSGLDLPVENRLGLKPAVEPDGAPSRIEPERSLDSLGLLEGVETFNAHPHLPQLDRLGEATTRMHVLARQRVDPNAPPHPVWRDRADFDALLQSSDAAFPGHLYVCDATLFSSTAGGTNSLDRLWTNIFDRTRAR